VRSKASCRPGGRHRVMRRRSVVGSSCMDALGNGLCMIGASIIPNRRTILCSQCHCAPRATLIPNELPSITEGNDKNMDQGFTGRGSPQSWQPTASA
jgi:hypothetical protein